jgi:hypothetical protein
VQAFKVLANPTEILNSINRYAKLRAGLASIATLLYAIRIYIAVGVALGSIAAIAFTLWLVHRHKLQERISSPYDMDMTLGFSEKDALPTYRDRIDSCLTSETAHLENSLAFLKA